MRSKRQHRRQILRHAKHLPPPIFSGQQPAQGRQLPQIGAGGLETYPMAALMGKHGVAKASMAKGVAQEGQLALVEASHPFEATLQSIDFACLAL